MAGTWNPADNWENQGGRIYATAMKLLVLEVYYRHLPLYQQAGQLKNAVPKKDRKRPGSGAAKKAAGAK
jgi:hypothetical protein